MRQNGWLHSLALLASLEPMVLPKSTTRATIAPAARCSMSWVTHSGILQAAKPVDTSVTHELETWWNDGSDQKLPTGAWLRLETRGSSGLLTSCRRWTRAAEHEPVGIYDDDDDADDESAVATNSSNDALGQTMRLDVQPTPASPSEDEGSYDAPQTPDTGQNHSLPDAADAHAGFYGYDVVATVFLSRCGARFSCSLMPQAGVHKSWCRPATTNCPSRVAFHACAMTLLTSACACGM